VDEGQRVKNRNCRLIKELKSLPTQNRLLLSGTPIQNTLEELWSLLNFVNPVSRRVAKLWWGEIKG
jgi:ATP-dependent DNA helicase